MLKNLINKHVSIPKIGIESDRHQVTTNTKIDLKNIRSIDYGTLAIFIKFCDLEKFGLEFSNYIKLLQSINVLSHKSGIMRKLTKIYTEHSEKDGKQNFVYFSKFNSLMVVSFRLLREEKQTSLILKPGGLIKIASDNSEFWRTQQEKFVDSLYFGVIQNEMNHFEDKLDPIYRYYFWRNNFAIKDMFDEHLIWNALSLWRNYLRNIEICDIFIDPRDALVMVVYAAQNYFLEAKTLIENQLRNMRVSKRLKDENIEDEQEDDKSETTIVSGFQLFNIITSILYDTIYESNILESKKEYDHFGREEIKIFFVEYLLRRLFSQVDIDPYSSKTFSLNLAILRVQREGLSKLKGPFEERADEIKEKRRNKTKQNRYDVIRGETPQNKLNRLVDTLFDYASQQAIEEAFEEIVEVFFSLSSWKGKQSTQLLISKDRLFKLADIIMGVNPRKLELPSPLELYRITKNLCIEARRLVKIHSLEEGRNPYAKNATMLEFFVYLNKIIEIMFTSDDSSFQKEFFMRSGYLSLKSILVEVIYLERASKSTFDPTPLLKSATILLHAPKTVFLKLLTFLEADLPIPSVIFEGSFTLRDISRQATIPDRKIISSSSRRALKAEPNIKGINFISLSIALVLGSSF